MATRRKGGADIDDLKARLGIKEEEPVEETPSTPEASTSGQSGSEPAGEAGRAAGVAQQPHVPREDYTTAVHDDTKPKYEPPPEIDAADAGVAPALTGVIVVALAMLVAGLILGYFTSSVSDKNKLYNSKIRDATVLAEDLRPVTGNLTALKNDLQSIGINGYTPAFDERLQQLFKQQNETAYALSPLDLANASAVLTVDEKLTQRLINYAVNTQMLKQQVDAHLAAVRRDSADLEKEAAGDEEEQNFAIIFDSAEQGKRWENYNENPEQNAYQPIGGLKVTYDSLDVETIGSGDSQRFVYTVRMPSGNEQKVPIYEVLPLSREQLVQRSTSETATTRYLGRVSRLKEALNNIADQGSTLLKELEDEANKKERFTL